MLIRIHLLPFASMIMILSSPINKTDEIGLYPLQHCCVSVVRNQLEKLLQSHRKEQLRTWWRTEDIDDIVQNTLLVVLRAIQIQRIRKLDLLSEFTRTILIRKLLRHRKDKVRRRTRTQSLNGMDFIDPKDNPELWTSQRECNRMINEILPRLSDIDQELLSRLYLKADTTAQICGDMNLTVASFYRRKLMAKSRFLKLAKNMNQKPSRLAR